MMESVIHFATNKANHTRCFLITFVVFFSHWFLHGWTMTLDSAFSQARQPTAATNQTRWPLFALRFNPAMAYGLGVV